ncbi:type III pantothenate kinase [Hyunsoonleella pacifica]|uniref:Type III pantothenate kinase n=1 Tax=Hyunsoonleella pacifica TaxID=1080224 RepID=A0A4Q9FPV5_9FLAO|nr:type III pantothenate kinase [Hyunsoonleella pacifica]TBN14722.1 type III pantothenate kinase [Hyunsoonleella pacifica]GGD16127.1 type III pantothenate kinase [Hyunsoonleella pacifica]
MNLIIDVGNTFVKLAGFEKDRLIFREVTKLSAVVGGISKLKEKYPTLQQGIVSSVGRLKKNQINTISKGFNLLELTHNTKVPFKNNYDTPKTLGIDRIALVSASVYHYPDNNVLIIDAGTCITYDFITNKNEYLGGAISPGIRMRYKGLNNLTANLPLLETKSPEDIIGSSTNSSIHSGVVNGVVNEIDGFINAYKEKYSDLTVILTGGDANFLSEQLKSSIFANSNFLLEGLNYILEFNSN